MVKVAAEVYNEKSSVSVAHVFLYLQVQVLSFWSKFFSLCSPSGLFLMTVARKKLFCVKETIAGGLKRQVSVRRGGFSDW